MPKRVLNEISLTKIAAVDLPCQEHAQALIAKNRDSGAKPDKAGPSGGSDSKEYSMSAINKALGLPETATEAEALSEIEKRQKAFDTVSDKLEKAAKANDELTTKVETIEKARKDDAHDESFTDIDGAVIKKSVVGGAYEQIKKMDERLQKAEFVNIAKSKYPNLEEETVTKALAIAKSANAEDRKAIDELLAKQNELLGLALERRGHSLEKGAPSGSDAEAELDKLAKEKSLKDGITYAQAYSEITKTKAGQDLIKKARSVAA